MHYIFVVADIKHIPLTGEEIINILFSRKCWLFSSIAPNLKKIKNGDKVIVYVSGRGNRYFGASFTISDEMKVIDYIPNDIKEKELFKMFEFSCLIENIRIWKQKLYISELKERLDFITDKKNYGLYFRQATKLIGEKDYKQLINEVAQIEKEQS